MVAQASARLRIGKQVVRQQGMQIEDGVTVKADLGGLFDQEFDGRLVVQDHLRFTGILAFGGLPQFQQALVSSSE